MSSVNDPFPKLALAEDFPEGTKFEPLPQPPEHLFGFLGNIPDIDPDFQVRSFWQLADLYGPLYLVNVLNRKFVVVSNYEYAHQIQDDETTEKVVAGPQKQLRPLLGNGLFTAEPTDKEWWKAHRLLVPVFGPIGVRKMFPKMFDIASQMILRWDRDGPDHIIDTTDTFTRLAFDTIGICAFDFRFNQFQKDTLHPFAGQMTDTLAESARRSVRTSLENRLRIWSAGKLQEDIQGMTKLVDEIIEDRKKNPRPEIQDLLNVMMEAVDPVTGEKLSDNVMRFNMLTFLVAGHETTSGTLAYLFYYLLKNPEKLHKAQQEVDTVLGDDVIEMKHIPQLKYIMAAIQETLRMNTTLTALLRHPKKDIVLSGKYRINSDTDMLINIKGLHSDKKIWGDDADKFKPERMLDGSHPQDAWRPFGIGMRSCLGRFFAEQEMVLNVALILQRFQVEMADPSYNLILKQTGTVKPTGFSIKARRRPGKSLWVGISGNGGSAAHVSSPQHHANSTGAKDAGGKMIIAYGSNAGTCKTLAEDLQSRAPEHGFNAQLLTLDQATEGIPPNVPCVFFTSSYEGQPPDNAKKFVSWLQANENKTDGLKDSKFTVFGVGSRDWVSTYQQVPKLVRDLMKKQGAHEVCDSFYSDVKLDPTGDYEKWTDNLWASLKGSGQGGEVEMRNEIKASVIKHDAPAARGGEELSWGVVKSVRSLGGQSVGAEKREVEIQLPAGVRYQTGDYLSVLPFNPPTSVQRVLARFGLHPDDLISVSGTRKAFLKMDQPMMAAAIFTQRVELGATVTQRQLETLQKYTSDEAERAELVSLADPSNFKLKVLDCNYSVLDVLEDHRSVDLPLAAYLDMLKPLVPRQYSISSSMLPQEYDESHMAEARDVALKSASHTDYHANDVLVAKQTFTATVTFDVHTAPARSGSGRVFNGVASSYLSRLRPGDRVHCSIRPTNVAFHLPDDPSVPLIFIAAGTGIAPMRGFIQERVAIASAVGKNRMGPALLYFGCRDYQADNLYSDELASAEQSGAVEVRRAFSKRGPPESSSASSSASSSSFAYVHERMWAEREEIAALFMKGAKVFLCGSAAKLAKSAADTLKSIWKEKHPEATDGEAEQWLQSIKETRYVTDVFD